MRRGELAVFTLAMFALFAALVVLTGNFRLRVATNGDNPWYVVESEAFRGAPEPDLTPRHFPGFPLAVAGVATLLRGDDVAAIAMVSIIASIAAVMLAGDLWGATIAAWFAVLNLDWPQRSILGGAEPLFALLLFLAIRDVRGERWWRAALFASLATVTRPLGVFLLIAIGIDLLRRRKPRALLAALGIATIIAAAYFALMHVVFGDALLNFRFYRSAGLAHGRTFMPYATLALSYRDHLITLRNVAKTLVWTTLTIVAVVAAIGQRVRGVEWLFAALYVASFVLLPAWWIEAESSRYLTPVIPLMLSALAPWLPSNRVVIWLSGVALVTLAALK